MRRKIIILGSLVVLGLAVGAFLFTDTARAIFFSKKPILKWSAPQSCNGLCIYQFATVCCDYGYEIVGGGAQTKIGRAHV